MASGYLLDTNTASAIIRGGSAGLKARLRNTAISSLHISAVTQGEMLYGLARKPDATSLKAAVDAFLLRVETLVWDSEAAEHYGRLRASLEAKGTPMGALDTMIAAHALATELVIVTNDQAFKRVPGLVVEDWLAP